MFKLSTEFSIPILGFGTLRIKDPNKIFEVVDIPLDVGYQHFDSAVVYRNERYIGEALKVLLPKYQLKREDIFITSKISDFSLKTEPETLWHQTNNRHNTEIQPHKYLEATRQTQVEELQSDITNQRLV